MFHRLFSSQKRSTFLRTARLCVRTRWKSVKKGKTMASLGLLVLNNLLRWVGVSFCNAVKVFTHSMGSARVFRAYRVRLLPSLSQLLRLSYRQTHNPWLNTEGVGMRVCAYTHTCFWTFRTSAFHTHTHYRPPPHTHTQTHVRMWPTYIYILRPIGPPYLQEKKNRRPHGEGEGKENKIVRRRDTSLREKSKKKAVGGRCVIIIYTYIHTYTHTHIFIYT